jgi:hypothetical protein
MIATALALSIPVLFDAASAGDAPALLRTHCLGCHGPDGAAPVRFDTPEGVQRHRGLMRALLEDRTMPPWLPADGPVPLAHRRRLDDAARESLLAALATPESTAREFSTLAPAAPNAVERDCVDRFGPDPAWTMPSAGGMRLRTYLVELPDTAPERIRGVRLSDPGRLAGSPVRLVTLAPDPRRSLAVLEEPGEAGFESMGSVGMVPSGALGAVSRVAPTFELPPGFAFALPVGPVAIEILGEPIGRPAPLGAELVWIPASPDDVRTVLATALAPAGLALEPGEVSERIVHHRLDRASELVGVLVKGGAFLRSARLECTTPDATTTTLLEIADFRMSLAEPWMFRNPVPIPAGSRLSLRLGFDNSAANPQQSHRPPPRVEAGLPPDGEDAHVVLLHAPIE